jgi:hypothetical protein
MSKGLPVVLGEVDALVEAAAGYDGVVFVKPGDAGSLRQGLLELPRLVGRSYRDPHSWARNVEKLSALLERLV